MKKFKWILLILTVLLLILFLFATCKKTKAAELQPGSFDSVFTNTTQTLTTADNNSGFVGIYYFGNRGNIDDYVNNFPVRVEWNGGFFVTRFVTNGTTGVIEILAHNGSQYESLKYIYLEGYRYFGFMVILGEDDNADLQMNVITLDYDVVSGNAILQTHDNYLDFNNYDIGTDINQSYNSNAGITVNYLYHKNFDGVFNAYVYDCLDFSLTFSEQSAEIQSIVQDNINQYFINFTYNQGYNSGYALGYSEGEDAGYTRGYNTGYNEGVNDNAAGQQQAYDRGYDDGIRDGYLPAYNSGYQRGYSEGEAAGLAGATPVSQTVTLLGSIFGAIGTVLSIQLFPGFSIGILILVPLFFAVLGLILWIWRRN